MLFLRVKRQKPAASALIYCLIAVFAVSGLVPPSAQAQGVSDRPEIPVKTILSSFQVPEELGTIRDMDTEEHPSGQFIIYLQVAHNHYDAEFHTQELIRFFHEKYGISLVFLEGGEGPLDRLYFRSFPDQEIKEKISQDYLKRGDLTGGETAAILLDDPNLKFYGAEDKAVYKKDKELFLSALDREEEINALLRPAEEALFQWMQSRDSRGRQMYDLQRAFRNEQIDLLHYLVQLKKRYLETAPEKNFQTTYPEIAKLLNAQEHQKTYKQADFQAALEKFLGRFETLVLPRLERGDRMTANRILQDYRTEKLDGGSVLHQLLPIAERQQAGFQLDPILLSGVRHAGNLASIRGTRIFQELKDLESEIREVWVSDPDEKDSLKLDEKIYFLKELSRLEVLPEELETLRGNQPSSLLPQNVLAKLQVSRDLRRTLDPLFEMHLKFYELAYERDEIMFKNTLRQMEISGKNSAIIVTGGFHTGGIVRHLKGSQISYAVITPKMESAGEREIYLNTMRGKRSFMRYFNGSLWDALARDYAVRIAESAPGRVLKEWRDRIIQNAMTEGRITEANFYTRYIDRLDAKDADEELFQVSNDREIQIKQTWDAFFGSYSETVKREKLKQFDVFADGFKALWAEGNVNPSSVGALFGRLQSVGSSQIAVELALTNDRRMIQDRSLAQWHPDRRASLTAAVPAGQAGGRAELRADFEKSANEIISGGANAYEDVSGGIVELISFVRGENGPQVRKTFQSMLRGKASVEDVGKLFGSKAAGRYQAALEQQKPEILNASVRDLVQLLPTSAGREREKFIRGLVEQFKHYYLKGPSLGALFVIGNALIDIGPESVIPLSDLLGSTSPKDYGLFDGIVQSLIAIGDRHSDFQNVITGLLEDRFQDLGSAVARIRGRLDRALERWQTSSMSRSELRLQGRLDESVRELDENAYPGKAKFLQRVSEKLFGRVTYQSIWERIKGRNAEIQGLLARDQYSSDDYDRLKEAIAKELKGEEAAIGPIHIGSFIGAMFSLAGLLNFKGILVSAIVHFSLRAVISAGIAAGMISFLLLVTAVLIQKGLSDYLRLEILQNALGNAIAEDSVSPSRFVPALGVRRNLWERVLETLFGWRIALSAKFRRSQTPPAPSILKPSSGKKRSELRGQTEILISSEASNWNELVRKINSAVSILSQKGFSRIDELELPGGATSSLIRGWQFVNGDEGRVLGGKLRKLFGASTVFFSRSQHRRGQKISITVQKVTVPDPDAGEGGSVQKIRLVFAHVPVQDRQAAAEDPQRSELRETSKNVLIKGSRVRMPKVVFGEVVIWKPEDKKINMAVYRPYDSDSVKAEKISNEISALRVHWLSILKPEKIEAARQQYSFENLDAIFNETIAAIREQGLKAEEILRQVVRRYTSEPDFEDRALEEKRAIRLIQDEIIPSLQQRDQLVYTETGSGEAAGQEAVDLVQMAQERFGVKLFERLLNLPYGFNTNNSNLIQEEQKLARNRRGAVLDKSVEGDSYISMIISKIGESKGGVSPRRAVQAVLDGMIHPMLSVYSMIVNQQTRPDLSQMTMHPMTRMILENGLMDSMEADPEGIKKAMIDNLVQIKMIIEDAQKEMDTYDFVHELNATTEEIADLKTKEAERHSTVMGKMAEIFPEMSERLSGILFGPDSGSFEKFVQNEISKGRTLSYAAAKFYYQRYVLLKKQGKLIKLGGVGLTVEREGNFGDVEPELIDFLMRYYDYAEFGIPSAGERANFVVVAPEIRDEIAFNRLQSQFRRHGHIVAIVSPAGTTISHWVIFSEKEGTIPIPGADFEAAGITMEDIETGSIALVDGREGQMMLNPDAKTRREWVEVGKNYQNLSEYQLGNATLPALFNGEEIEIGADEANIEAMEVPEGVTEDTSLLYRFGAAFVGLFRMEEFFFHMKKAYQGIEADSERLGLAILKALLSPFFVKTTRPLVMRVFDPQGDKLPPEAWWGQNDDGRRRTEKEIRQIVKKYPNTRFYLNEEYPEFRQYLKMQLAAAFMAAEKESDPSLRILFPNVQTEEDVQRIKNVVDEAKREYLAKFPSASTAQHAGKINAVPIGFMYEKQGAVLSPQAKFIGIGSNDLLQDILGVSRDDEKAGKKISLLNPQLVREIWRVGAFGKANEIEVTLEGEWGGSRRMLLVLLMMRLKGVKIVPVAKRTLIPELKEFVRHVTPADLEELGDLFEATITAGIALPEVQDLDAAVTKKVKDIESRIIGSEGFRTFLEEKERQQLERELRGSDGRSELREEYEFLSADFDGQSADQIIFIPQGSSFLSVNKSFARDSGDVFFEADISAGEFNQNLLRRFDFTAVGKKLGMGEAEAAIFSSMIQEIVFNAFDAIRTYQAQDRNQKISIRIETYPFSAEQRVLKVSVIQTYPEIISNEKVQQSWERLLINYRGFQNRGPIYFYSLNSRDLEGAFTEAGKGLSTIGQYMQNRPAMLRYLRDNRGGLRKLQTEMYLLVPTRSYLEESGRSELREPSREEVEALVTALEQDPRHAEKLFEEFEALLKKSEGTDSPDDIMRFLLTLERVYETAWETRKDNAVESLKDLIHLIHEKYLSSIGTQEEREWDFSTRVVEAKIHLLFSRFGSLDGLANKEGALLESPVSDGEGWLDELLRALKLDEPGEEEMPERSELRLAQWRDLPAGQAGTLEPQPEEGMLARRGGRAELRTDPITGFPQPYSLPPAAEEAKVDDAAKGSATPGEGDAADRERRPAEQDKLGEKRKEKSEEPAIQRGSDTFETTVGTPPAEADGRDIFIPTPPPVDIGLYQPAKQKPADLKRSELRLYANEAAGSFLTQDAVGFIDGIEQLGDPETAIPEIREAVAEALEASFDLVRGKEAKILTELISLRNLETSNLLEFFDRNEIPVSPEFESAVSELMSRLNRLNADSPEALAAELERQAFALVEAMKQNIPDGTSAVFEMPSAIAQLENRDEQLDQFMKAAIQTLLVLNIRLRIVAEGSLVNELSRWLGRNSNRDTQAVNGRIQIVEARSRELYADNTEAVQATEDLGAADQAREDLVLLGLDRYGQAGTDFDYQDSKLASKLLTAMFAALLRDQITDNLFVIEGNTRRIKNPEAFQVLVYALHTLAAQARALARSA